MSIIGLLLAILQTINLWLSDKLHETADKAHVQSVENSKQLTVIDDKMKVLKTSTDKTESNVTKIIKSKGE